MYNYVLFKNTHTAIGAERDLRSEGIDCELIPVPRSFSDSCGLCIRYKGCDYQRVLEIMEKRDIEFYLK